MDGRTVVGTILEKIGHVAGQNFLLNDEGFCDIAYRDLELVISVPEASEELYLYAFLMPAPQEEREKVFENLLKVNFLRVQTGGAFFALSEEDNQIVLVYPYPIEQLDFEKFEVILKNFIERSLSLRTSLLSEKISPLEPKEGPGEGDMLTHLKFRI